MDLEKKKFIRDHNRDIINTRANTIFEDPDTAKYVWNIGFHSDETCTSGNPNFDNLGLVRESDPDKNYYLLRAVMKNSIL